ncbi:MAG: hypothetical protein JW749_02515 [Sedimentisphaerales bacterium]|nr:hypothetical protein [Sedimentisphaerales bacterium]
MTPNNKRAKDKNSINSQANRVVGRGRCIASFFIGMVFSSLVLLVTWQFSGNKSPEPSVQLKPPCIDVVFSSKIRSLNQLLALTLEQLESVDIGLMNLLCAQGLEDAEDIDIDKYLAILDEWAEAVKKSTEERMDFFRQHSKEYDNSESVFKMVNCVFALKHIYGVHYNLENMKTVDYSDSTQIFIHGLLGPKRNGSCVSIPVLYAAIAHRLGYPVRLVPTSQHTFLRWEDNRERFNIEASTKGCATPPDEHYKEFPRVLTDLELKTGPYLKSMSAADVLCSFLIARGYSLMDTGCRNEAQIAFANAYRYSPNYSNNLIPLAVAVDKEMQRHWESDCKTMGTKKIRYTNYSGFTIDPCEADWMYPPLPPVEVMTDAAKKNNITQEELLHAQSPRTVKLPRPHTDIIYTSTPPALHKYLKNPYQQQQMNTAVPQQNQQISPPVTGFSQQMTNYTNPSQNDTERNKQ